MMAMLRMDMGIVRFRIILLAASARRGQNRQLAVIGGAISCAARAIRKRPDHSKLWRGFGRADTRKPVALQP
jgi:hypothetical protein